MPTPPKPISIIKAEGNRRHLTKAEIEKREKEESALLTGISLKEWPGTKAKPVAHKEFMRLKKLLKSIGKDDALNEAVINRYCVMTAEVEEFEKMKMDIDKAMALLKEQKDREDLDPLAYIDKMQSLLGVYMSCDKNIMAKRKMLLQIERENVMTIAAALRAIPKKPEEAKDSKMAQFLKQRAGMNGS